MTDTPNLIERGVRMGLIERPDGKSQRRLLHAATRLREGWTRWNTPETQRERARRAREARERNRRERIRRGREAERLRQAERRAWRRRLFLGLT